eukprot:908602-Rhodomonas_salina.2
MTPDSRLLREEEGRSRRRRKLAEIKEAEKGDQGGGERLSEIKEAEKAGAPVRVPAPFQPVLTSKP